ncbi:hypothetical protein PISMIDRAFT_598563 [Pisolithus microcarpus 441]|uniref:Uncharacterized protein n=1 Tax=Pisolithus microcarpus 441 TaxID=765257 RepID=A0A0C9Y676_9AGAM|nr:hypothetical protein PISMIDRAFT_598563 [Pisolithus microcarpus 441]
MLASQASPHVNLACASSLLRCLHIYAILRSGNMTLPHFLHLVDFSLLIPHYQARKFSAHAQSTGPIGNEHFSAAYLISTY